jgi:hypothetical protein
MSCKSPFSFFLNNCVHLFNLQVSINKVLQGCTIPTLNSMWKWPESEVLEIQSKEGLTTGLEVLLVTQKKKKNQLQGPFEIKNQTTLFLP